MATYEVTGPDGHLYHVDGPDGASDADVLAQVRSHMTQAAPPEQTSAVDAAMIGTGHGFDRLAAGLRQAVPDSVRGAIDSLGNTLGMGQAPSIDPAVQAANTAAIAPVEQAHPIATALGEAAPMMASGPVGMAALAGLSYGTPAERLKDAAGAFIGGKLGQGLGYLGGRIAQPIRGAVSNATQKAADLLDQYGIKALPSQQTGSVPLGYMESVLSKLPGGSPIRAAAADQQSALNKATMSAMGGEGDAVTPEALNAAKQTVGSQFESIPAGHTVVLDDKVANSLNGIESDYMKNLSADQKGVVGSYLDDIRNAGDTIPGETYQKWRSRIAARANSTQDSELKGALTGIYRTLDDAFNRSATGTAVQDYATARAQYRVQKTLGGLANVTGNVSPARLATAAKNLPGQGGDLAQLGQAMKALPDSATAQRLFYQGLLSGGIGAGAGLATGDPTEAYKYAGGAVAAPYLASKLLTSNVGSKYLTQGLLKMTPELEKRLMRVGGWTGGLLGQRLAQ